MSTAANAGAAFDASVRSVARGVSPVSRHPKEVRVMAEIRFNVYGRLVAVERVATGWLPFVLGPEGKRRRAEFEVPDFVTEAELGQYLADLFHESATPGEPTVYRVG
jgi:hypothetical protein